jgi:hypothetical protein
LPARRSPRTLLGRQGHEDIFDLAGVRGGGFGERKVLLEVVTVNGYARSFCVLLDPFSGSEGNEVVTGDIAR